MEKAAVPADEGARTGNEMRSASPFRRRAQIRTGVQIRRQAAFGMPSYLPPRLTPRYGENANPRCSARARFASQIAPKAAASPPLPRYGEAVPRRVRLYSASIKSYTKNQVYSLHIWVIQEFLSVVLLVLSITPRTGNIP